MTTARERILRNVRNALSRDADDSGGIEQARERIRTHPRQIEPAFDEPYDERFCDKLRAAHATVARIENLAAAAVEIEAYLEANDVGKRLVTSAEGLVTRIDWPMSFEVRQGIADGDDRVSLTSALFGIAETGTLMLVSGETSPTSLNFLPDYHIVLIEAGQLLPRMEDAWDGLRDKFDVLPRTVNFISGPSKTADVEQTVEYGAHGPRCLHVILIE